MSVTFHRWFRFSVNTLKGYCRQNKNQSMPKTQRSRTTTWSESDHQPKSHTFNRDFSFSNISMWNGFIIIIIVIMICVIGWVQPLGQLGRDPEVDPGPTKVIMSSSWTGSCGDPPGWAGRTCWGCPGSHCCHQDAEGLSGWINIKMSPQIIISCIFKTLFYR